ncbi:MAG: DNA polymerase/3'-5' exonuclease PolX [Gaiellaceae bacterium]
MATGLPRNSDVADQFDLLADLLELEGTDAFQVIAYRRAASLIRETPRPIAELALAGRAKELPGIGATIEGKIVQIVEKGEIETLTRHRERVPPDVVTFMKLPGLGPKTVKRVWQELGITTREELRAAAEQQQLRSLRGLGPKTEENVLKALAAKPAGPPRTLLGTALPALLTVVSILHEHPAADLVSEAGSARRRRETVRDLDIIATATDPRALTTYLTELHWVAEVVAKGPTKATVVSHDGLRFDLRVVPPESYGNLLQHFTGSKEHNVALREDAVRRGFSISEYGVQTVDTKEVFQTRSEEELYAYLGYQFIPPELRENRGELAAAREGSLPERLVEASDLRGDLHTHTRWSDGRNTVEEMAVAARERGYAYLAICDHSQRLRDGALEAQAKEIDAVAERVKPLKLLKGVEVNIRADSSLDMSDEDLAGRDWVVASLHSSFDKRPTERILAAMESPHVDCIGHPTGRKINTRPPADVEVERLIEQALATSTALEINSQPDRLDLTDAHARAAAEAGVRIPISSDGHGVETLQYVEIGAAQARRAWMTPEQVLNTRPWSRIRPR